jgi:putative membrane-bound dehydrogenase-like protein
VNYRRHKERDPKGDRVMVLEDTDGDGRADQATPFVQEPTLVAPLGMAVIGNKIIVSNAPDLIVYTDVDGNRVFNPAIDKREVLLTGFDGRNHDHALHSVTFGPDGRWYFSQGNAGAHFTDRGGKTFRVGSAYNPVPMAAPCRSLVRRRRATPAPKATMATCTSAVFQPACWPTARAWKSGLQFPQQLRTDRHQFWRHLPQRQ